MPATRSENCRIDEETDFLTGKNGKMAAEGGRDKNERHRTRKCISHKGIGQKNPCVFSFLPLWRNKKYWFFIVK